MEQQGDKLLEMIVSKDPEMFQLGMQICREQFPGIWAAFMQYSGMGEITKEVVEHLSLVQAINIGTVVRYRGLEGTPDMVITDLNLVSVGKINGVDRWKTMAQCKYWNKSKQDFSHVTERIEVLEIVPRQIKKQ